MYISISVSNITSNGHHYNRHLKLVVDNFSPEVQEGTGAQPGLNASVRISQNLAVYICFWEFDKGHLQKRDAAPGDAGDSCRNKWRSSALF